MVAFRPEHQLNIDDGGRPFTDEEEDWGAYDLSEWVLLLDGQPDEEREKYRPLMPPEFRRIFFGDEGPVSV